MASLNFLVGYRSSLISTIVDSSSAPSDNDGYRSSLISTIVDHRSILVRTLATGQV